MKTIAIFHVWQTAKNEDQTCSEKKVNHVYIFFSDTLI